MTFPRPSSNSLVSFVTFHVYRTEWACRAKILACSATDAAFHVHSRISERMRVALHGRNHLDSSCWTVACAVAALYAISVRDAILLAPHSMSDLSGRLVFFSDEFDCSSRANLRTLRTFRTTVTTFVRHFRLHKLLQICRRAKHAIRTCRHAELASRTVLSEIASTESSRRNYRCLAVRYSLVFYHGKSAVNLLLLRLDGCGCGENSCG